MNDSALKVHVTRGLRTESEHLVDAIVVDADGKTLKNFGIGDSVVIYPRSSIKMLQAISFVESGAYTGFQLSKKHLALACSSHKGEKIHTDIVLDWLKKIDYSEANLICGPHYPSDEKTKFEFIAKGILPAKCHNNCSGKHTAFLSTMKHLNMTPTFYEKHDHQLQVRLRKLLSELCGENFNQAQWGIDGCGIPSYAMKLHSVARGMAQFLDFSHFNSERSFAMKEILEAIQQEPDYFAGTQDFATQLIRTTTAKPVVKSGAEGICAGLAPNRGFAFALKVRDGSSRAASVAAAWILQKFGAMTEDEKVRLSEHTEPNIKNWAGQPVGKIFVAGD